jgi:hypothetical protein
MTGSRPDIIVANVGRVVRFSASPKLLADVIGALIESQRVGWVERKAIPIMCWTTAMGFAKGSTHPTICCLTGKSLNFLSSPRGKNIPVLTEPKSPSYPHRLVPQRGAARDRHGRWERDAVDAAASARERGIAGRTKVCERFTRVQTNDAFADGEVVWSWHPLLMLSLRRRSRPDRVRTSHIRR